MAVLPFDTAFRLFSAVDPAETRYTTCTASSFRDPAKPAR